MTVSWGMLPEARTRGRGHALPIESSWAFGSGRRGGKTGGQAPGRAKRRDSELPSPVGVRADGGAGAAPAPPSSTITSRVPLPAKSHGRGGPGGVSPAISDSLSPAQIRGAYGISQLPAADNGAGQTIAIVDAYDDPSLVSSTSSTSLPATCTCSTPPTAWPTRPAS